MRGALGRCVVPLEIFPPGMQVVAHAVPHYWAVAAWLELVFDGAGVERDPPDDEVEAFRRRVDPKFLTGPVVEMAEITWFATRRRVQQRPIGLDCGALGAVGHRV